MDVPVLKQGDYLIASVQSSLSDVDLLQLRDALVANVGKFRSVGVIVDVTGLDAVDSYAARMLRDMAFTVKLRGAEMVIVGLQPEIAITMVRSGLTLEGVTTTLDLDEGLAYLDRTTRRLRGIAADPDGRNR